VALVLQGKVMQVVGTFFLDADDLWKPTKLQNNLDYMTNNAPFTFSFMIASMRRESISKEGRSAHKPSYKQLFFCNYVGNLTEFTMSIILVK
jgi:hypothetical protein